jgi:hypothetical protein
VQWRGRGSSWLFYLRRGGLPHPHIDGLGLFFALLITSIGTLVLIEAGSYLAGHHHLERFYIYLLTFMAAMLQTAPRGVTNRVTFAQASAKSYDGQDYNLVCFFDCLHDMGDPVGRMYYAASTFICTPNSLSQEVGLGLGAQAGEARLRNVFMEAGFTRFRRATETLFNLILEARK